MAKQKQKLRVSIVIPAYNEASTIEACLDAIAAQTVKPFEVILVDNNSSDETVALASEYRFVKVISESQQGVIHARNTGFDYAHGDIIGRIDADTVMREDWVETLQTIFANKSIDGVSGTAEYHSLALARTANLFDQVLRRHLARKLGKNVALQGANMAFRRSIWPTVKSHICTSGGFHEDLDFSIHSNELGFRNVFDDRLVASISFRQAYSSVPDYVRYMMLSPGTYAQHGIRARFHMYPVIFLSFIMFPVIKACHKGYDPDTRRFSLERLLEVPMSESSRVNPATYVD